MILAGSSVPVLALLFWIQAQDLAFVPSASLRIASLGLYPVLLLAGGFASKRHLHQFLTTRKGSR
jgi:hypothetical protein